MAEIKKEMAAIEDEAIKKMPAEDQRAAEGPDRPQVVSRRLSRCSSGKAKDDYTALKKERGHTGAEDASRRASELALSVNNCDARPPPTHLLVRGIAARAG